MDVPRNPEQVRTPGPALYQPYTKYDSNVKLRLVYNWVITDLEISLFHDSAPILSISELQCPLPMSEVLWMGDTSAQWMAGIQTLFGCTTNVNPHLLATPSLTPSLHDLFQDFLHDNLAHRRANLTPQQMRLLLHPLQSLLCHLRQIMSCFSDITGTRQPSGHAFTRGSTKDRLEEVQSLLQKWYELAMIHHKANPGCSVTQCNLVMYHLMSLNAVTSFPEIERLARKEGFGTGGLTYLALSLRHKRCIHHREKAIFHCGQVLRLLRGLPRQPSFWGAAIYRVSLILWTDGIGRLDPSFRTPPPTTFVKARSASPAGPVGPVIVDQVTPEDPAIVSYLWGVDNTTALTRMDGTTMSLDNPSAVLELGIEIIEAGTSTRLGDGIKRKLTTLLGNWRADSIGGGSQGH